MGGGGWLTIFSMTPDLGCRFVPHLLIAAVSAEALKNALYHVMNQPPGGSALDFPPHVFRPNSAVVSNS